MRRGFEKAKERYGIDVPEELIDPGCLSDTKSDFNASEIKDAEILRGVVDLTPEEIEGIRNSMLGIRRKAYRARLERALGNKVKIQMKTKIFEKIKKSFRSELVSISV